MSNTLDREHLKKKQSLRVTSDVSANIYVNENDLLASITLMIIIYNEDSIEVDTVTVLWREGKG